MISGDCDSRFTKVADVFRRAINSGHELGATLAIEYDGQMVVNLWGGHRDRHRKHVWAEDTIVNVFSVTKGVVAICTARLVEEGKLDLEQTVAHYWPEYGCEGKGATTVMELLCHRGAMHGFRESILADRWQDWDFFTKLLERQSPFGVPGAKQSYHALTFGWLVGELIKRVDGRSVGNYFRDEVATPLHLDFKIGLDVSDMARCADKVMSTTPNTLLGIDFIRYLPDLLLPKTLKNIKDALCSGDFYVAFPPNLDPATIINSDSWRLAEIPSANGHGTAASLATLYGIICNGGKRNGFRLLAPETINLATKIHSNGPDTVLFGLPFKFGLGFMVDSPTTPISHAKRRFGHSGIGGETAFGDLKNGVGFAFLSNQQHRPKELFKTVNQLARAFYRLL
ncbi:MAG: serine hydrolase [Cellvibrionales bacterium TMED49]|nr:serine hydrolase [Porticoccaceae bacterium]OUU39800.1 MAG: serine hydrolase [Cellvibrionales bacterium TMED49]